MANESVAGGLTTPNLDEVPKEERALLTKLENNIRIPQDLKAIYTRWKVDRDYVSTIGGMRDTPNTVATNLLLRTQYAQTANLYPRSPKPRLKPGEWIPEQDSPDPEIQQLALLDQDPTNTYPDEWINYIKAQEIVIDKQQLMGNLKGVVRGMVQDTLTLPVSWLKKRFIEDYGRDPIGVLHEEDINITAARYNTLKRGFDDEAFTKQDARYAELLDLNDTLKSEMMNNMATDMAEVAPEPEVDLLGEIMGPDPRQEEMGRLADEDELLEVNEFPVIPHYQGYVFESIDPEDIRFDWRITRPEDIRFAWWMAHRVFMPANEVSDKWELSAEDELALIINAQYFNQDGTPFSSGDTEDKADREERSRYEDIESQTRGKFVAVWEYWDRRKSRVYRWVQGFGKMLDDFKPEHTARRFFPFFSLQFNRVTGQFFGPSDCELLKPLQEELNMLRTHEREARKSAYPRFMVSKGFLSRTAKREMRTAAPYSVIEVEKAQEIAGNVFPLIPAQYNPSLYDGTSARRDYEAMAGMSQSSLGITGGAELATEAAIANQQTGIQADSRKDLIVEMLREIYESMAQVNAQRLSEENAKLLAGPGTPWLGSAMERGQILNNFNLVVEATPNGTAESQAELKKWMDVTTIVSQLGLPINRLQVLLDLLRIMDLNTNIDQFVDVNALLAPPPIPGAEGGQPGEAGGRPDQQGPEGAGGGRPETDSSQPQSPESVPNAPQLAA